MSALPPKADMSAQCQKQAFRQAMNMFAIMSGKILARRQAPAEIVELLNKEINAGLSDPTLNTRLGEFGGTALRGTSAEFETLFVGDAQKWAKVMRAANIKSE